MSVLPKVVRKGAGLPLIAIHGNGVDHRLLLALDDCLAVSGSWERNFLDLPGFGGTPPLDGAGGLPELADWLVGAVRELVGTRQFAILASSLGGLLARHVIAQSPGQVLGVALIAPVVEPDVARRALPDRSVIERDDDLIRSLPTADRDEFTDIAVRQVAESWEAFSTAALPGILAADPDAMDRLSRRYFLSQEPSPTPSPFEGPTLIVTGRQDHIVGYEDQFALLADYPRATYLVVDGAGHNVHLEQPDLVESAVRDWSRRVQLTVDADVV